MPIELLGGPMIRMRFPLAFTVLILVVLLCLKGTIADESKPPVPLIHAHAHNDYEHTRPLFEALECGFCSVEADIHLVDGELLVAHDRKQVRRDRTLQSLYLDTLRKRIKENGGRVYRNGRSVWVLVDLKSELAPTYVVLGKVLVQYAGIL